MCKVSKSALAQMAELADVELEFSKTHVRVAGENKGWSRRTQLYQHLYYRVYRKARRKDISMSKGGEPRNG